MARRPSGRCFDRVSLLLSRRSIDGCPDQQTDDQPHRKGGPSHELVEEALLSHLRDGPVDLGTVLLRLVHGLQNLNLCVLDLQGRLVLCGQLIVKRGLRFVVRDLPLVRWDELEILCVAADSCSSEDEPDGSALVLNLGVWSFSSISPCKYLINFALVLKKVS